MDTWEEQEKTGENGGKAESETGGREVESTQIRGHSESHMVWLQDRTNKNLPQSHFFQIWLLMVKAA